MVEMWSSAVFGWRRVWKRQGGKKRNTNAGVQSVIAGKRSSAVLRVVAGRARIYETC